MPVPLIPKVKIFIKNKRLNILTSDQSLYKLPALTLEMKTNILTPKDSVNPHTLRVLSSVDSPGVH